MRNYVECCLGGEPALPEMSISKRQPLADGDVLLVCTDGIWANLKDSEIAGFWRPGNGSCKRVAQGARRARDGRIRAAQRQCLGRRPVLAQLTEFRRTRCARADGRLINCGRCGSRAAITAHAEGSVLAEFGATRVLCTASVENGVPHFLRNSGRGWLTAEYGMLPRATHTRTAREAARGKQGGRTQEIQRLIGARCAPASISARIGERTITIDCDVLQADGGTRTAAITGGYVALADAVDTLMGRGQLERNPLHGQIAAVSVGIVGGVAVLDLDYAEDAEAETDMNVVMNSGGAFIEVQGTAEGHAFRREELDALLDLAAGGIGRLCALQNEARAG